MHHNLRVLPNIIKLKSCVKHSNFLTGLIQKKSLLIKAIKMKDFQMMKRKKVQILHFHSMRQNAQKTVKFQIKNLSMRLDINTMTKICMKNYLQLKSKFPCKITPKQYLKTLSIFMKKEKAIRLSKILFSTIEYQEFHTHLMISSKIQNNFNYLKGRYQNLLDNNYKEIVCMTQVDFILELTKDEISPQSISEDHLRKSTSLKNSMSFQVIMIKRRRKTIVRFALKDQKKTETQ